MGCFFVLEVLHNKHFPLSSMSFDPLFNIQFSFLAIDIKFLTTVSSMSWRDITNVLFRCKEE